MMIPRYERLCLDDPIEAIVRCLMRVAARTGRTELSGQSQTSLDGLLESRNVEAGMSESVSKFKNAYYSPW